ncbi:MAG TPA: DUF1643 domain-containing protein [Ohtaekwangia sp.]|nr:DUF1643 domain-containing protein [Ohtaekwangia sp.]
MKYKYQVSYAIFSADEKHRLGLYRLWNNDMPAAMVIGLNPSTANDHDDDPTIGFVRRVLDNNGYGSLYMLNLFTMITPYPTHLERDKDETGVLNTWRETAPSCKDIIFAWGQFPTHGRHKLAIKEFGDRALCFGKNKNGTPRHPMYLKPNTKLIKYGT